MARTLNDWINGELVSVSDKHLLDIVSIITDRDENASDEEISERVTNAIDELWQVCNEYLGRTSPENMENNQKEIEDFKGDMTEIENLWNRYVNFKKIRKSGRNAIMFEGIKFLEKDAN